MPPSTWGPGEVTGAWMGRRPLDRHPDTGAQLVGSVAPCLGRRPRRRRTLRVPLVFRQLSRRRLPQVFGDDYDTPDGTCVRDFVHVADVADVASAHVAAAAALAGGRLHALTANIGRDEGVSVRELVATIRRVTGTDGEALSEPVIAPRRAGDPARVVAPAELIRRELGWSASHGGEEMVASAWAGWQAQAALAR